MILSADDITAKRFSVTPGGYDQEQVISFLEEVAANYRVLMSEEQPPEHELPTGDEGFQVLGRHVADILASARRGAEQVVAAAERQAKEVLAAAKEVARRNEERAEENLESAHQLLEAAQREAADVIATAERRAAEATAIADREREEADALMSRTERETSERLVGAREEAASMIEEASRRLDEAGRARATTEQGMLALRDSLGRQATSIDELVRTCLEMKALVDRLRSEDSLTNREPS